MKYLRILTLALLMCTSIPYAETIKIEGSISEFSCSADDINHNCADLHGLVSENFEQNKTINNTRDLLKQPESKFYSISISDLGNNNAAVILADYI